jgi:hypothetical protein
VHYQGMTSDEMRTLLTLRYYEDRSPLIRDTVTLAQFLGHHLPFMERSSYWRRLEPSLTIRVAHVILETDPPDGEAWSGGFASNH